MNKQKIKANAIIQYLVNKSGKTRYEISRMIGRSNEYVGSMTRTLKAPRIDNVATVAKACGYEIHIIGNGDDLVVDTE